MVRLTSPDRPNAPGLMSSRLAWRLFSLILGAAAVAFLIRELGRPEVAERVDRVMAIENVRPAKAEPAPPADPAQFRELMKLAGWDAERFAKLHEAGPLSDAQRTELIELLWRLRTFDAKDLSAWAQGRPLQFADEQSSHVGELFPLVGRVTKVTRHELPPDLVSRFELPAYYECEMTLSGDAGDATILTTRVPQAWLEMTTVDEPAAASAVLVDVISDDKSSHHGLFASREIAWFPTKPNASFVSLGKALLGDLGVDVGLFDGVRQRSGIAASEAELFYQLLGAAGQIGANQLDRFALQQLPSIAVRWANEGQPLKESSDATSKEQLARQQLAREVQARAAKGLYSVAPLFNDAKNQLGELVALVGVVRRVQPITTDKLQYYELDLFTDDSQNNPIVAVVRELPPGFPTGDRLHEPVRIAGWFFKVWSFESHRATLPTAPDGSPTPANLRQFAPLIVARSPVPLQTATASTSTYAGPIAAAIFLALLAIIWVGGWWLFREDRRFARTLAQQYALPAGESLNDLQFDLSESTSANE